MVPIYRTVIDSTDLYCVLNQTNERTKKELSETPRMTQVLAFCTRNCTKVPSTKWVLKWPKTELAQTELDCLVRLFYCWVATFFYFLFRKCSSFGNVENWGEKEKRERGEERKERARRSHSWIWFSLSARRSKLRKLRKQRTYRARSVDNARRLKERRLGGWAEEENMLRVPWNQGEKAPVLLPSLPYFVAVVSSLSKTYWRRR